MATKPYPKMEEKPTVANEPSVAYSSAASVYSVKHKPTPYEMEILRRSEEDSNAGRVYTQEEVDKLLETMAKLKIFDTRQDPSKLPY